MREGLYILFLIFYLNVTTSCQQQSKSPNIIIIFADDLGYGDLSSYGSEIPTPNIDRIGESGIRFTDFYVAAPVCTPSRYSLLTGSYPQRSLHGLSAVIMPGNKERYLDKSEKTLAEVLKGGDYNTAIFGKWHLGKENSTSLPTDFGFDAFSGFTGGAIDYYYHAYAKESMDWYVNNLPQQEEGYATNLLTTHAIKYLEEVKASAQPFFIYLPYNAPHYGKTDTAIVRDGYTLAVGQGKSAGLGVINSLQVPKEYLEKSQHIRNPFRRAYAAMVSNLDGNVGKILSKLENEGLLEDTMVWFISDNGGYSKSQQGHASNGSLRGEKASLYEGGIRVPAMVSWNGHIRKGQVISQPASTLDLLPTLAAITGTKKYLNTSVLDGHDISDVIFNNATVSRDFYWKYNKQSALRSGHWKMVNEVELYNLKEDKEEKINLAGNYPKKLKELRMKFDKVDQSFNSN